MDQLFQFLPLPEIIDCLKHLHDFTCLNKHTLYKFVHVNALIVGLYTNTCTYEMWQYEVFQQPVRWKISTVGFYTLAVAVRILAMDCFAIKQKD